MKWLPPRNGVTETLPYLLSMMNELGGPHTYNHYPVGWAHAMDAPMQWTKQVASHFGGTRNGLVISWPKRIADKGGIRRQFSSVIDITPTLYEAIGITPPKMLYGSEQKPSMASAWSIRSTKLMQMWQRVTTCSILSCLRIAPFIKMAGWRARRHSDYRGSQ